MIWSVNSLQIRQLKEKLGICSQLSISFTTYESGSRKILAQGRILQDACGEIVKEFRTFLTGSYGKTILRLIYKDKGEPTIAAYEYYTSNPASNNPTT